MKNLTMTLALLVVLALASPSFAGIWLNWTPLPEPAPGLTAFMVSAVDDGGALTTVSDISIDGLVNNVWDYTNTPTTSIENCTGLAWVPAWTAMDTHAVYTGDDLISSLGDPLVETNGGGTVLSGPFPGYDGTMGLGTFGQISGTIAFEATTRFDLVQLVLPAGTNVWFNARLVADGVAYERRILVPNLPEPSMLVLLLMGAMCLVGCRRRGG